MYASQEVPPKHGYRDGDPSPHDLDNQHRRWGKRTAPAKKPRSLGRRAVRAMSRFFLTLLLGVSGTLAWQSHGNEAKEMLRTMVPALDPVLPASAANPPASYRTTEAAGHQLEEVSRNLAVVRDNLENLAARQEQIAFHLQLSHGIPSWAAHLLPGLAQASAKAATTSSAPAPAPSRSTQQPVALR
jgi:hypothetical protein